MQSPEADLDRALCAEMYLAGFRAAREMAAKEAEDLANPKSLVDDSFGEYIAEAIRTLGEEEVPDGA